MPIKGCKELIQEANAVVETITTDDAKALVGQPDVVFVDVRDGLEHAQGCISGAVHASRGMLEFCADPNSPMHNPALDQNKRLVVYCGSGGRSALAAKTLKDMGFEQVCHIAGGFGAWREASGPVQD